MRTLEFQIGFQIGCRRVRHVTALDQEDLKFRSTELPGDGEAGRPSPDDTEIDSEDGVRGNVPTVGQHV